MNATFSRPRLRPRWYRLYFALAAFDLVTILFSLYLNHRLLAIHADTVAVNQTWADRLNQLADLAQFAGAANAPGNDVFDSRDVPRESARLQAAATVFDTALSRAETEFTDALPTVTSAPLRANLLQVREAMRQMIAEAELIFSFFTKNQPDRAGERMATMDRRFSEVTAALAQLNLRIRGIQTSHFRAQLNAAANLRRFERLIAFAIILMVVTACVYGHKMASAMSAAAAERERFVEELQAARNHLEQRVAERTGELTRANESLAQEVMERRRAVTDLQQAQEKLVRSSRLAGMAEVATGVLHNIGNVLNSVNISATVVSDQLRQSKISSLAKVNGLLRSHVHDLGVFLTSDSKGRQIPEFLATLAGHLEGERARLMSEMESVRSHIDHIKEIVAMQQSFATVSGVNEMLPLTTLVEDALRFSSDSLARHQVQVIRVFAEVPAVCIDKHKVLQILVNLIRNAKQAMENLTPEQRRLTLRIGSATPGRVFASVSDAGIGIAPENLTKIFQHGFTTKRTGHGFGLHSSANAAKEMDGCLTVHSDGPGCGATFRLELPINQLTAQAEVASADKLESEMQRPAA